MLEESIEESPTSDVNKSRQSFFNKRNCCSCCRSCESDSEVNLNKTFPLTQNSIINSDNNEKSHNISLSNNANFPLEESMHALLKNNNNNSQSKESSAIITNFRLFEAEMQLIMADRTTDKIVLSKDFPESQGFTTCQRLYDQMPETKNLSCIKEFEENTAKQSAITLSNENNRTFYQNQRKTLNMNNDCGNRFSKECLLSPNTANNATSIINNKKRIFNSKEQEALVFNTDKKTLSLMKNKTIADMNYEPIPGMETEEFFSMDFSTSPLMTKKEVTNMDNKISCSEQDKIDSIINNLSHSNVRSTITPKANTNSKSIVESILTDFQDENSDYSDSDYSPLSSPRWRSRSPLFMLLEKPKRCYETRNKYKLFNFSKEAENVVTPKLFHNWDEDGVIDDDDNIEIKTTVSNTNSNMSPAKDIDLTGSLPNGTNYIVENLKNITNYFLNKAKMKENSERVRDPWSNLDISDDEFLATPDYEMLTLSESSSLQSLDINNRSENFWNEDSISTVIDDLVRLQERRRFYVNEDSFSSSDEFFGFQEWEDNEQFLYNFQENDLNLLDLNLHENISSSFEIDLDEISSKIPQTTIIRNPEIDVEENLEETEDNQLQILFEQLESNQISAEYLEELNAIGEVDSSENIRDWEDKEESSSDDNDVTLQLNVPNENLDNCLETIEEKGIDKENTTQHSVSSKTVTVERKQETELVHLKELSLIDEIDVDNWHNENDFFIQQPTTFKNIEDKTELGSTFNGMGFQTAAGKNINVSKAAQKAVANLLKDFQEIIENDKINYEEELRAIKTKIQETKTKQFKPNTNYMESSASSFKPQMATESIGFQTANGKSIKISKKAVQSVQHILQDFQHNNIISNDNLNSENEATQELNRIKMEMREKQKKERKSNVKSPSTNNHYRASTSTTKLSLSQPEISKSNHEIKIELVKKSNTTFSEAKNEHSLLLSECENMLFSEWPFSPENNQNSPNKTPKVFMENDVTKIKRKRSLDNSDLTSPHFKRSNDVITLSQLNETKNTELSSPFCLNRSSEKSFSSEVNKNNESAHSIQFNGTKEISIANNCNEVLISPCLNRNMKATSIPNYFGKVNKILSSPHLKRHFRDLSNSPKSSVKMRFRRKNSSPLVKTPKRSILNRKNILSLNKIRREQRLNALKMVNTKAEKTIVEEETKQKSSTKDVETEVDEELKTPVGHRKMSEEQGNNMASSPSTPEPQDFIRSYRERMQTEDVTNFLTSTPQSVCRSLQDLVQIAPRQYTPIVCSQNLNNTVSNLNDSISVLEGSLCSEGAQERIDRLNSYGEAPTITPLRLNTSNKCRSSGLRRTRSTTLKPS